jgi:hypothetical protein
MATNPNAEPLLIVCAWHEPAKPIVRLATQNGQAGDRSRRAARVSHGIQERLGQTTCAARRREGASPRGCDKKRVRNNCNGRGWVVGFTSLSRRARCNPEAGLTKPPFHPKHRAVPWPPHVPVDDSTRSCIVQVRTNCHEPTK